MKCPNCGNLIPEGKLLCEHCGEEINIVPEFDIEIEAQINETLGNIARSFEEQEENEDINEVITDDELGESDMAGNAIHFFMSHRKSLFFIMLFVFAGIVISLFFRFNERRKNTYEYQYEYAMEQYNNGNYEDTIAALDRALAIEPEHYDARLKLAQVLIENGNESSAESMLVELLKIDSTAYLEETYGTLLELYKEQEEYIKLGELLRSCTYADLLQKYADFTASKPVFSLEEGVYDKVQKLSIESPTDGFIYYTLDGTVPTRNSMVYQSPIVLESGDYTVKAIFVNMYGVESDMETKTFYVSLSTPKAPVINLESGKYTEPQMIEIFHDTETKVYYTIDGSTPNKKSNRYTEPIEMLYGMSNLAVISINKDGLESEVVRRSYQLSVDAVFADQLAVEVLMNNLIVKGIIENTEGKVTNKLGYNSYIIQTAICLDGNTYYIVSEKYTDTTGKIHNTNNLYAINVNTAELFKARKIGEGNYYLLPFE